MISDDWRTWHVDLAAKINRSDPVGKKPFVGEKKKKILRFRYFCVWRVVLSHTIYLKIIIVHPIISDPSNTQMTYRTLVRILARLVHVICTLSSSLSLAIELYYCPDLKILIPICLIFPPENLFIHLLITPYNIRVNVYHTYLHNGAHVCKLLILGDDGFKCGTRTGLVHSDT